MDNFWCDVLAGVVSSIISGFILIAIGVLLYKNLRKRETIVEANITKELKIQAVVNEFQRMRKKYSKPLTAETISTQVEQELTDLYGDCEEIKVLCKEHSIPFDQELNILMNFLYAQKGVLYCNNPVLIANERFSVFENLNKMQTDGIMFDKSANKLHYFQLYQEVEGEIKSLIAKKEFFYKYWKNE